MKTEIEIPIQPPRVTLHKARALRDELEARLKSKNDRVLDGSREEVKTAITAVALQFRNADTIFHTFHSGWDLQKDLPVDFAGKRALEQLHELGRFVASLEKKYAPGSLLHGSP